MSRPEELDAVLRELRTSFDASFASPRGGSASGFEEMLALRAGGAPYALRLRELAALTPAGRIVPVGARSPALLGIAGVRGELVPVYSLAVLLGHACESEPARWLGICRARAPVALAIERLEGHLRVAPSQLHAAAEAGAPRPHVLELIEMQGSVRAVIDVASVTGRLGPPESAAFKRRGSDHS